MAELSARQTEERSGPMSTKVAQGPAGNRKSGLSGCSRRHGVSGGKVEVEVGRQDWHRRGGHNIPGEARTRRVTFWESFQIRRQRCRQNGEASTLDYASKDDRKDGLRRCEWHRAYGNSCGHHQRKSADKLMMRLPPEEQSLA